jgi:hypothetical protein
MTDFVSNREHEELLALGHLPQIGPTRGRRLIHLCGKKRWVGPLCSASSDMCTSHIRFVGPRKNCADLVIWQVAESPSSVASHEESTGRHHEGALRVGGATIGVIGCGVDVTYPREDRLLERQVQRDGLLLSEAPEGRGFPKRNRSVSGPALAVSVAEAPQRSGALMRARLAREEGRDVFAIPREITNPRCAGCLALLRMAPLWCARPRM